MKTLFKYPIPIADEFEIALPSEFKILSAGPDPAGRLCMWALVDSSLEPRPAKFFLRGTGHPMLGAEAGDFVATMVRGQFVWHLFTAGQS